MRTVEPITVLRPGHYKVIKSYCAGRICECGAKISIYNNSIKCFKCLNMKRLYTEG